jgi:pSer/pThr/pTyr-binding forkhead associated (FHA) protein
MQAVLVMIRSDGERRSFSIARDMTVVGRREDCDLRIPLGEVSRKHCRFVRDGEAMRLEDLGSSNGTFHNGERIQESVLAAGDTIQVGPVIFVLQVDGVPADEDLQPVATQEIEGGGTDIGPEVTQPEYATTTEEEYAQAG